MTLSVEASTGAAGRVIIALCGELDQTAVGAVRDAVAEALTTRPPEICLDLTLVTFLDSSGLGAMVAAYKACDRVACRLTLAGVSPKLYQRLQVSGLTGMFGFAEPPS